MLGIGVVVVVLVAIFIFLWNFIIADIVRPENPRRDVDNFVGRNIEVVLANTYYIEHYDFVIEYDETDLQPEGTIIRQTPAAGRPVAPGSDGLIRVTLTVAAPSSAMAMPDLTNMTYEEAQVHLTGMGVPLANISRREQASDDIMENRIIETLPAAGQPLLEGMPVFLFVSIGPEEREVRVPNLDGMTLNVAITTLQGLGLDYETVMEYSDRPNGVVIGQSVAANTMVAERTQVILTVSSGPEPTPTPSPTPTPPPETPTPPPATPTPPPDENGTEE